MNKAVYDKSVPTRNLITTVMGVIAMIIPILAVVGLITPEQSEGLSTHLTVIGNAIVAIVGAVSSLILIFKAKD
jgi:hypothetical protein